MTFVLDFFFFLKGELAYIFFVSILLDVAVEWHSSCYPIFNWLLK